jgi:hypothetical protein
MAQFWNLIMFRSVSQITVMIPKSRIPKLPPTKIHLVAVRKGASVAGRKADCGKRNITQEVVMFSKKSKTTPNTGARLITPKAVLDNPPRLMDQLIDVARKNP